MNDVSPSDYIKTPAGLDLAEALLAFNPAARPSAAAALELPYFTSEDPPAEQPMWCVFTLVHSSLPYHNRRSVS